MRSRKWPLPLTQRVLANLHVSPPERRIKFKTDEGERAFYSYLPF